MTETTKISEAPVDTEALMNEMAGVQQCFETVKEMWLSSGHRSSLLKLSQHIQGLHVLLSAALRELKALRQENELTLVVKLASIVVHADEMMSDDGHAFDRIALKQAITDPEVTAWIKTLGPLAPVKRKP